MNNDILTEEDKSKYQKLANANSVSILNMLFANACQKGLLSHVQYLLTSSDLKVHADIHHTNELGFAYASSHSHLNVVQYLLSSPELKSHSKITHDNFSSLIIACGKSDIPMIEYLINLPLFVKEPSYVNILFKGFFSACMLNNSESVKYLINLPLINTHINEHAVGLNQCFALLCKKGYLNMIQYLLEDSPFKNFIQINKDEDYIRNLYIYKHYHIIEYLLYSPHIEQHLSIDSLLDLVLDYDNQKLVEQFIIDNIIKITPELHLYIEQNNKEDIRKVIESKQLKEKLVIELNKNKETNNVHKPIKI